MSSELAALLARFAEPADRVAAAAALARHLGADRVLLFVRDPELGVLLPAPGFPQTVTGGPTWRAFVKLCASPGVHSADVDLGAPHDPTRLTHVVAHVLPRGVALLLFDGAPDEGAVAATLETLPLMGALFGAEHAVRLARGEAAVSETTGRRAKELALALDAARGEVERALAESARLNAELQEADRRKDDFMAMLGHELRNPMSAIAGAIEVMRARPGDLENVERARTVIERQTAQLARLVDDLLDVARITRGKITLRSEVLEISDIVKHAIEATLPLATARKHEIRLDVRSTAHARVDRARLEQMVTNLLTNAVKYTDPGGHIRVTVDRAGGEALVSIQDDGIGISPEMLPRIFDAFQQVDATLERGAGGLGVGLTVVGRLATLHGGRVVAESELGKGSTFTIHLPASEATASTSSPTAASESPVPTRKRVLVVDDNVDSAEMMVILAETWGHEAFHARDGRTAVTMADELAPDVVLLDIGLPGMDGYQVAARLRENPRTNGARIIAVSGYGQASDRVKSRAAGCDEHLVKPVDIPSLERVLGRV